MTEAARLEEATRAWLESLRVRRPPVGLYDVELGLAAQAVALVDADRARDGVLLGEGTLEVEHLEALDSGYVDLSATLSYPADGTDRPVAEGRVLGEHTVTVGTAFWTRTGDGWRLADYVRDGRRMSATWCTHPLGEDVVPPLAAVPQALTVDGRKVGRVLLEVHNDGDEPLLLRVGRPPRPKGLFTRQPPVTVPEVGVPLPAHDSTHLLGRTARPSLTEVEVFAFDAAGDLVAELRVPVSLRKGHPGGDGVWCPEPGDERQPEVTEPQPATP